MPYVQREAGKIVGCFSNPQAGYAEEWVADDSSDLHTFLNPIPKAVTMRQARQQLFKEGLLSSVDAVIASLPSPQKELAQIEWDKSQFVERNRPLVLALGAALGLSSSAMDQLFVSAAGL